MRPFMSVRRNRRALCGLALSVTVACAAGYFGALLAMAEDSGTAAIPAVALSAVSEAAPSLKSEPVATASAAGTANSSAEVHAVPVQTAGHQASEKTGGFSGAPSAGRRAGVTGAKHTHAPSAKSALPTEHELPASATRGNAFGASRGPGANADESKPGAMHSTDTAGAMSSSDTLEALPVAWEDSRPGGQFGRTGSVLGRIAWSLLGVLALLLGLVKFLLPRLMQCYPAFFERLKQDAALRQEANAKFKPGQKPGARPVKAPKPHEADPPMVLSEAFSLAGSLPLGKDRALHLVTVQGRQLVIAVTPYAITLLKDLSEPVTDAAPQPEGANAAWLAQAAAGLAGRPGGRSTFGKRLVHKAALSRPLAEPAGGAGQADDSRLVEQVIVLPDYDDTFQQ